MNLYRMHEFPNDIFFPANENGKYSDRVFERHCQIVGEIRLDVRNGSFGKFVGILQIRRNTWIFMEEIAKIDQQIFL